MDELAQGWPPQAPLRSHRFGPHGGSEGREQANPSQADWTGHYHRRSRLESRIVKRFFVAVGVLAGEQVLALSRSSQAGSLRRLFGSVLVRVQR
jgi:hypothetical protein